MVDNEASQVTQAAPARQAKLKNACSASQMPADPYPSACGAQVDTQVALMLM